MEGHIFISHSSKDLKVANRIYDDLKRRGIACWMGARDIEPGMDYQSSIVRAIRASKALLIVFTKNANDSTDVSKEVALANKYKVRIIPGRLELVEPSDALEYELTTRQWHDLFGDWGAAMDGLAQRIGPSRDPAESSGEPIELATPSRQMDSGTPQLSTHRLSWRPRAAHLRAVGIALSLEAVALLLILLWAVVVKPPTGGGTFLLVGFAVVLAIAGITGFGLSLGYRPVRWPGLVFCIFGFLICLLFAFTINIDQPAFHAMNAAGGLGLVVFASGIVFLLAWKESH